MFSALTTKVNVPAVVGVPDNVPVAILKVSPGGIVPVGTSQVIGVVLVAVKFWVYDVPTTPPGTVVGVMVGAVVVGANVHDNVTALAAVSGDVFVTTAALPFIVAVNVAGNVCPISAVSVMDAVYCVPPVNGLLPGAHVTGPLVKLPGPVDAPLGAAPVAGAVTFIAVVGIGVKLVAANSRDTVTVLPSVPGFVTFTVASTPLMVAVKPVWNVCPAFAVRVTDAVYCLPSMNVVPPVGDHVIKLTLKLPVAVAPVPMRA